MPTPELVERVARAICRGAHPSMSEHLKEAEWQAYINTAQAVLDAYETWLVEHWLEIKPKPIKQRSWMSRSRYDRYYVASTPRSPTYHILG